MCKTREVERGVNRAVLGRNLERRSLRLEVLKIRQALQVRPYIRLSTFKVFSKYRHLAS
jgi:hypothetical protein